jgi:transposase
MSTDPKEALQERPRRRRYDTAFKRAVVEQTRISGVSVARVAREHGINANQVFKWRRQFLLSPQDTADPDRPVPAPASLVPVTLVGDAAMPHASAPPTSGPGYIKIRVTGGEVHIHGTVDAATLQVVLSSLRR